MLSWCKGEKLLCWDREMVAKLGFHHILLTIPMFPCCPNQSSLKKKGKKRREKIKENKKKYRFLACRAQHRYHLRYLSQHGALKSNESLTKTASTIKLLWEIPGAFLHGTHHSKQFAVTVLYGDHEKKNSMEFLPNLAIYPQPIVHHQSSALRKCRISVDETKNEKLGCMTKLTIRNKLGSSGYTIKWFSGRILDKSYCTHLLFVRRQNRGRPQQGLHCSTSIFQRSSATCQFFITYIQIQNRK